MTEEDTQKIIDVIVNSKQEIKDSLSDHEKRIQRLETAVTVHGLKIGAIVAIMMAFGGVTWNVIKDALGWK